LAAVFTTAPDLTPFIGKQLMKLKPAIYLALAVSAAMPTHAADSDLDVVKQELEQLKQQYLAKIAELEQRLQDAEEQGEETVEQTEDLAVVISQQSNRTAPNTFNPGIGVVLNGKYLSQSPSDYEFQVPGFFLGEEPGPGEPGLALDESELNMKANVDDKFLASVTLAFGEGVEVEEAFLQTMSLPAGLRFKFGRFFSGIGYLNSHHAHTDDFAMRPLAYQAFLGKNFSDDGIQLSWLATTDFYWETGMEIYRGDSFPAAGSANSGTGVKTLFSHIGGDINASQSWQGGLSYLTGKVMGREAQNELQESFSGDSELWLADFIWKWAPNGNSKSTNAKIQAEYFRRNEQGQLNDINQSNLAIDSDQSGWYVQGVYQFMPQWRVGVRYEALQSDDLGSEFDNRVLDNLRHDPKQLSVMLDWSNSEFSRVRLQYNQDKSNTETANLWLLQYIAAFGAHGAHAF
jgi:hypothetical protein